MVLPSCHLRSPGVIDLFAVPVASASVPCHVTSLSVGWPLDPIPLFIAASGPRALALTAKLGAGRIDNVAEVERGAASLGQMRTAWAEAGQPGDRLTAVAWIGGAVLDEGEPAGGPRGMAVAGPRAAMLEPITNRGQTR